MAVWPSFLQTGVESTAVSFLACMELKRHSASSISKWIQEAVSVRTAKQITLTFIHHKHDSCPMCRRLLVQPSSNPAETTQSVSPFDAPFDPDITVGELERQIRQHVELLRARLDGLPLPSPEPNRTELLLTSREDDSITRNEFSGMYS
jgi:hypothetical protein